MLTIIPAIDLLNGSVVRLSQGDFAKATQYNPDPLAQARIFESWGVKRLHLVDLDGARMKHIVNKESLRSITEHTELTVDFGGGLRTNADIETAFACGASQITAGSVAVTDKSLVISWIKRYGAERIILGLDVKNNSLAIHGWTQTSDLSIFEFVDTYHATGLKYCICTDVSKDGMLTGPSFDLYSELIGKYPEMNFIASGGICCTEDLRKLDKMGMHGAILGRALYEKTITPDGLMEFIC